MTSNPETNDKPGSIKQPQQNIERNIGDVEIASTEKARQKSNEGLPCRKIVNNETQSIELC
jgi:hypothetical protein